MTDLMLGVAKVDITPVKPVPLAGFAHRAGLSIGVLHPLYLRVFLFQQGDRKLVLIIADLIWWGPELVVKIRNDIAMTLGIPLENVLLHATHNHSGPQTTRRFTTPLGICDDTYIGWLERRVHEAVRKASDDLEPVSIQVGEGMWQACINRRRVIDGKCLMAPNQEGPNDSSITVIRFKRINDDVTKGILVHATCHPTTTDENYISSEFPGVAMDLLESNYGPCMVAGFLQGFCGNIRPALVENEHFVYGNNEDVERIADALFSVVKHVIDSDTMLDVGHANLSTYTVHIPLEFTKLPSIIELKRTQEEPGIRGEWARLLLSEPERLQRSIPLEITAIRLTTRLGILAVNAEMVVEYGLKLKSYSRGYILPMGYTNGIIGYVPTASQIQEGGYEVVDSFMYFGLPSPFSEKIEAIILHTLDYVRKEHLL